jgi:catechol 2,3-dioxygenase-like lactoylglutathione lyase family enzyme
MPNHRIAIVSVPVADQEAAKAFYRDKLGFEVVSDNPMGPDQRWIELAPEGSQTSITLVTWFEQMPPGTVQGLVLETDDIETTRASLLARGVEVSPIDETYWGKFATFADPDGNGWALTQISSDA